MTPRPLLTHNGPRPKAFATFFSSSMTRMRTGHFAQLLLSGRQYNAATRRRSMFAASLQQFQELFSSEARKRRA